jgi:hypothetical protein
MVLTATKMNKLGNRRKWDMLSGREIGASLYSREGYYRRVCEVAIGLLVGQDKGCVTMSVNSLYCISLFV